MDVAFLGGVFGQVTDDEDGDPVRSTPHHQSGIPSESQLARNEWTKKHHSVHEEVKHITFPGQLD